MKTLELPLTIRTARPDELPMTEENISRIEESKSAKIVEGYAFYENVENELPFDFFAEINIDNSRLWSLFKTLLMSYEEEISFMFGHIDNEPFYGLYMDKFEVLNQIEKYNLELTQDGFLEFGVIYHDSNKLKEVFVRKPKYIQFWGTDKDEFINIMENFSLYKINDIKFIDEFPLATENLKSFNDNVVETADLIGEFQNIFLRQD